jgi:hypothetical protein
MNGPTPKYSGTDIGTTGLPARTNNPLFYHRERADSSMKGQYCSQSKVKLWFRTDAQRFGGKQDRVLIGADRKRYVLQRLHTPAAIDSRL